MADTISRYNPQSRMVPTRTMVDRLLENSFLVPTVFDGWVGGVGSQSMGPVNLVETGDSYVVQLALPGLDTGKLNLQVADRNLEISGSYDFPGVEQGRYIWQGLQPGEFNQSFTLPAQVTGEKAEANYHDGILTITLPKAENARVKSIPVKTAK